MWREIFRKPKRQEVVDIKVTEEGSFMWPAKNHTRAFFKGVKKYVKKGDTWVINPTYDRIVNKPVPFCKVRVKVVHKGDVLE